MIQNNLKDFNLEMTEARKEKRRGRAKGGIIFGTKKGLVEKQILKTDKRTAAQIKNNQESRRIIITYNNGRQKRRELQNNKRFIGRQQKDKNYDWR